MTAEGNVSNLFGSFASNKKEISSLLATLCCSSNDYNSTE
jgi:hypothetical protein